MHRVGIIFLASIAAAATASERLERKLLERVEAVAARSSGVVGFATIDLASGRSVWYNGDTQFAQASVIKVPILVAVFRSVREGSVRLDQPVAIAKADAVGGSGHLQMLLRSRAVELPVRDVATAMIETSDNTATNKLIGLLGMDRVNETAVAMGLKATRLQRVMLDTRAAAEGRENISTPLEMARLMEMIYRGKAVDEEASREMLSILKLVDEDVRKAVPARIAVASKSGSVAGVRNEVAIVFLEHRPFVISIMSSFLGEGENPVPALARAAYEHFEKVNASNAYGNRVR